MWMYFPSDFSIPNPNMTESEFPLWNDFRSKIMFIRFVPYYKLLDILNLIIIKVVLPCPVNSYFFHLCFSLLMGFCVFISQDTLKLSLCLRFWTSNTFCLYSIWGPADKYFHCYIGKRWSLRFKHLKSMHRCG